jgi:hypothetical protein
VGEVRSLRETVAFYLDDVETQAGRVITIGVTGFILLSCGLFILDLAPLVALGG